MEHFWHQFGNSIYLGVATMVLTVLIGSLASFSLGRMRLRKGWIVTDFALLTYVLPTAFLVIPFVHIMHIYGMSDSLWAVIAAMVTFATPYAILILHQYGKLIPMELDESAKIDGASPLQVYLRIYLPLMAPALVAVGVYALLLAWNEYIYQYLAAVIDPQHDGGGGDQPVLRQRRGAVELHDGDRDHLFAAADRDLFRAAPLHGGGPDVRRGEGLARISHTLAGAGVVLVVPTGFRTLPIRPVLPAVRKPVGTTMPCAIIPQQYEKYGLSGVRPHRSIAVALP